MEMLAHMQQRNDASRSAQLLCFCAVVRGPENVLDPLERAALKSSVNGLGLRSLANSRKAGAGEMHVAM
jgi:hypothetical protein